MIIANNIAFQNMYNMQNILYYTRKRKSTNSLVDELIEVKFQNMKETKIITRIILFIPKLASNEGKK